MKIWGSVLMISLHRASGQSTICQQGDDTLKATTLGVRGLDGYFEK